MRKVLKCPVCHSKAVVVQGTWVTESEVKGLNVGYVPDSRECIDKNIIRYKCFCAKCQHTGLKFYTIKETLRNNGKFIEKVSYIPPYDDKVEVKEIIVSEDSEDIFGEFIDKGKTEITKCWLSK